MSHSPRAISTPFVRSRRTRNQQQYLMKSIRRKVTRGTANKSNFVLPALGRRRLVRRNLTSPRIPKASLAFIVNIFDTAPRLPEPRVGDGSYSAPIMLPQLPLFALPSLFAEVTDRQSSSDGSFKNSHSSLAPTFQPRAQRRYILPDTSSHSHLTSSIAEVCRIRLSSASRSPSPMLSSAQAV